MIGQNKINDILLKYKNRQIPLDGEPVFES